MYESVKFYWPLKNQKIVIVTNHTEGFVTCAVLSWYRRMRGCTVFQKTIPFLPSFPVSPHL